MFITKDGKIVVCERESQSGTAKIYTRLLFDIFRAFLLRTSFTGDWYWATSHPRPSAPWGGGRSGEHPKQCDIMCHCSLLTVLTWLLRVENFHHYIFFRTPRHSSYTIHVAFPLSFVYLKTQLHILFLNPRTNQPVKGRY